MKDTPEEWTEAQNALFVRVYRFMIGNQSAVRHPKCFEISPAHWQTICHNAAWTAAEMLETDDLTVLDADTEEVVASSGRMVTH